MQKKGTIGQLVFIFTAILFLIEASSCKSGNNEKEDPGNASKMSGSSRVKKLAVKYAHGKQLFGKLCNTCHVAPDKNLTDQYTFDNLFDRLPTPSDDYFVKYIQDSKSLKSAGDKYAIEVDRRWNSEYEHAFKDSLSYHDLSNLIVYIKAAANQRFQASKSRL